MHCFPRRFQVSHHIGSNSNSGKTLEESTRLLDSDVLRTVTLLKQSKNHLFLVNNTRSHKALKFGAGEGCGLALTIFSKRT